MERTIEDGYDEISIFIKRTVQIKEYEPLTVGVTLKRMIEPEERKKEINNLMIDLEEEVNYFLGIKE